MFRQWKDVITYITTSGLVSVEYIPIKTNLFTTTNKTQKNTTNRKKIKSYSIIAHHERRIASNILPACTSYLRINFFTSSIQTTNCMNSTKQSSGEAHSSPSTPKHERKTWQLIPLLHRPSKKKGSRPRSRLGRTPYTPTPPRKKSGRMTRN